MKAKSQSSKIIYRSTIVRFDEFCALGTKHELYARWGIMSIWYELPLDVVAMAIAYHDDVPVGMAILMNKDHSTPRFGVYVERSMRRQKIGSRLTRLVRKRANQEFVVDKSCSYRDKFFSSLGLRGY